MIEDLENIQKATLQAIAKFSEEALNKIFSGTSINRIQMFPKDQEQAILVLGNIGVVNQDNSTPMPIVDIVASYNVEVKVLQEFADSIYALFPKKPLDISNLN